MAKRKAAATRELIVTGKDKGVAARAEAAGDDAAVQTAYRTATSTMYRNVRCAKYVLMIIKAPRTLHAAAFGPSSSEISRDSVWNAVLVTTSSISYSTSPARGNLRAEGV